MRKGIIKIGGSGTKKTKKLEKKKADSKVKPLAKQTESKSNESNSTK